VHPDYHDPDADGGLCHVFLREQSADSCVLENENRGKCNQQGQTPGAILYIECSKQQRVIIILITPATTRTQLRVCTHAHARTRTHARTHKQAVPVGKSSESSSPVSQYDWSSSETSSGEFAPLPRESVRGHHKHKKCTQLRKKAALQNACAGMNN
jgi:hypothetical protein